MNYVFNFQILHETRFSSIIENEPLQYATLAYLEVSRVQKLSVDALQFLDQYYQHARQAVLHPASLNLLHASLLVLSVVQSEDQPAEPSACLNKVEIELCLISLVIKCLFILGKDLGLVSQPLRRELLKIYSVCVYRIFRLPFKPQLALADTERLLSRVFETILHISPVSWPRWFGIGFNFLRYVASHQTKRHGEIQLARASLMEAFSAARGWLMQRLKLESLSEREQRDCRDQYLMMYVIQNILTLDSTEPGWIAKEEGAKWLIFVTECSDRTRVPWRSTIVKCFFAGFDFNTKPFSGRHGSLSKI